MAVYTGKVNLINMSNITATAGVGIQSTYILYAVSNSGDVPPDLEGTNLITLEGEILSFASTGFSFHVIDGILWAQQEGSQIPLQTEEDKIVGFAGWTAEVPSVDPGQYLWSKTIYVYTDGKQTITYNVSRWGADGQPGPMGPSTSTYRLNYNQSEILKFVELDGTTTTISPAELRVSIFKDEPNHPQGEVQVTDLDIASLTVAIYNIDTDQWFSLTNSNFIDLEDNLHNFVIKLQKLVNEAYVSQELAGIALLNNETIIKIEYALKIENAEGEEENFNLIDYLNVRYGMNKDMASFSVKASDIVAMMQDSKMNFNAEGLTLENGAFKIIKTVKDESGEVEETIPLLYSENGNLVIAGDLKAAGGTFAGTLQAVDGEFKGTLNAVDGTFKGILQAAEGSFAGDITAARGRIGGFEIGADRLISTDKENEPSIILDGTSGHIEANNITLGTGAVIKEYIKIGEQVELRKAATSNDSFIKVVNDENVEILGLKANGTLNLGNGDNSIILSGADGSIMSQNYRDGLGWKISNTNSIFNDVTVRGSIRASVLEYGETQAIGGALLVRPSSRILEAVLVSGNTVLTLEEIKGFNINDFCRIDIQTNNEIGAKYYKIIALDEANKKITVEGEVVSAVGKPVVSFGQQGDNVGICINGSIDDSFGTPQSISVFDFDSSTKAVVPRIVLGKLPDLESIYGYAAGTYGLYAENVLLKGSLVTQTDTTGSVTYSGISTLYSGANAPTSQLYASWFGEENVGEILLWAGAKSTKKIDIENAKFFVDRNGNLFAGSGYFKGTIITDATITASAIETAVLRGSNDKPGEPALRIEDASKGIYFSALDSEGKSTTVFEVTKDSIVANVPNFKFNSNFTVGGNGSLVVPNLYIVGNDTGNIAAEESTIEAIMFDNNRISYSKDFKQNELVGNSSGYIDFANGLTFSPDGANQVLNLSSQWVRAIMPLYIQESVKYNDLMEYKPAYSIDGNLIGYDLYIE